MLDANQLHTVFPRCTDPQAWAKALAPAMERYQINNRARAACFLAQTGHESGQFNRLTESLVYSKAERIMAVWPKRFPTLAAAAPFVSNEQALANKVYASRLGNGDPASGDGWRYRGRGLMQITGRSNYADAGKSLGMDLVSQPELLAQAPHAAMAAAWFWQSRGLNALADDGADDDDLEDFERITVLINGATTGLGERLALFEEVKSRLP